MSVTFAELTAMLAQRPLRTDAPAFQSPVAYDGDEHAALAHVAYWQNKKFPALARPRLALYASAYSPESAARTQQHLQALAQGAHAVTRLASLCNSDVRVYEMDLTHTVLKPLSETEAAHAISYGLMAAEEGIDLVLLDLLSDGHEAVLHQLLESLQHTTATDVFPLFAATGAVDLCAALGAALGARMGGVAVMASPPLAALLQRAFALLCNDERQHIMSPTATFAHHAPLVQPLLALHRLQALMALAPVNPALTTLSAAA